MDLLSARHVHYRLKDEPKKGLDDDDHSWLMDEKSPTLKRGDTGIRRPNKKRSVSEAIAEKIARYTQAQQGRVEFCGWCRATGLWTSGRGWVTPPPPTPFPRPPRSWPGAWSGRVVDGC